LTRKLILHIIGKVNDFRERSIVMLRIIASILTLFFLLFCAGCSASFIELIKEGNTAKIKAKLANGAAVNEYEEALVEASKAGHTKIVKLLLEARADVNAVDFDDRSALMWAAKRGHGEIVDMLLNNGAQDVQATSYRLKLGMCRKRYDRGSAWFTYSVEAGTDGPNALTESIKNGYVDIVAVLLEHGSNPNVRLVVENIQTGVLHPSACIGECHLRVEPTKEYESTPLILATTLGHIDIVQLLLEKGAAPMLADAYEKTAVAYAAELDHKEIAQILLQDAISDYNNALNKDSSNVDAYYNRGKVYVDAAMYDDAILDFNRMLVIKPINANAFTERGYAYQRKGNRNRALSDYSKAIEIDPRHERAYELRGLLNFAEGKYDEAISDISQFLEINPLSAGVWWFKALAYEKLGRIDEAIDAYRSFIKYCPSAPGPSLGAGIPIAEDRIKKLEGR